MEVDIKPVIASDGTILEFVETDTFVTKADTEISGEEWHIGPVKTEREVVDSGSSDIDEYDSFGSSDTDYEPTPTKSKLTSTKGTLRKCGGTVKDAGKGTRCYPCDQCHKSFRFKKNLQDHVFRVHDSNELKFKCPQCPKYFKYQDSVRVHLRSHTNERPFVCNVCKLSFTKNSYLVRHKTIHLEVKPYLCLLCELRFGRRDTARSHIKHLHKLKAETDFVNNILYQKPKPEDFGGDDEDNNIRRKSRVNMVGVPCVLRGRPRVRKPQTDTSVSVLPKRCFVNIDMSSASDSSTTQNKSRQSDVTPVVKQKHKKTDDKTEINVTFQMTSEGPILQCIFCTDVFCCATDLVNHYSSHSLPS